ncbi:MAG TPA: anthranilate synthase component I family protein [Stellaceae bacterium]|nr:anthranilate synthase component I family protein [Stellaceae bacterium]
MRQNLARHFGADAVFLIEALAGPPGHRPHGLLALGPLVTVSVAQGELTIDGHPVLAGHLMRRALASGGVRETPDGRLMVPEATKSQSGGLWSVLRHMGSGFAVTGDLGPGFGFGFLGYFGYDAIRHVEALPYCISKGPGAPEVCFSIYQTVIRADAEGTVVITAGIGGVADGNAAALAEILARVPDDIVPAVPRPRRIEDSTTEDRYLTSVETALEHIRAGDIYQVQIGHELTIDGDAAPEAVYARLRRRNPAPYMVLGQAGGVTLAGASPEVFVRVTGDQVLMRPLAGTIPRRHDPLADEAAARKLAGDPKEIAEHIMLVDLCRNDIGRFCAAGSLEVPVLLATEAYSHVHHLVSTVTATIEAGADIWDIVAATFPAGTMTGAPKVRAMEIIEALETRRRGLYAGAFGWIDFASGDADLALCIRTAIHDGRNWSVRASAGIVADSDPAREWRETRAKMAAGYWAITGEEL